MCRPRLTEDEKEERKGMFCKLPEVEKHLEAKMVRWVGHVYVLWKKNKDQADMIKCFELTLLPVSWKQNEEEAVHCRFRISLCVYIHLAVPRFSPSLNYFVYYVLKGKVKVKLATIVEGDPKAPFSIATTPRCRGGRYSIPRIAPLYPWTVPYNAEC